MKLLWQHDCLILLSLAACPVRTARCKQLSTLYDKQLQIMTSPGAGLKLCLPIQRRHLNDMLGKRAVVEM